MKKLELLLEYLGLKLLMLFIGLMPWGMALKFGEWLGVLLSKILKKRFNRTCRDIKKAFPNKTEKEVYQIALESWRNIGRIVAETVQAYYMPVSKLKTKAEIRNGEDSIKNSAKGLGGILHIGHFVNWEVFGMLAGIQYEKMSFVAKPQSNPYVDKLVNKVRMKYGSKMISAYNPFFACFRALKKGYMIGILSDQSVHSSKIYMNFLNRPAEVAPLTAMLALKMQVPVYPVRMYRENGKIIAEIGKTLWPPKTPYSHDVLLSFTATLQKYYEEWIYAAPQTWLWGHNRWKREDESRKEMQKQAAAAACATQPAKEVKEAKEGGKDA
ncbi:MAG: hypothetical protein LBM71_00565 [Elusimicrobiota bacterium]|jgi:KDO2-lipid IV(A) lauroyltransferase|nr:hypothetical protein [Elusimicrobiota bacterium]